MTWFIYPKGVATSHINNNNNNNNLFTDFKIDGPRQALAGTDIP